MKRLIKPIVMMLAAILLLVSMFGCYGNMTLTKKVWAWNGSLGDDLTVNIVFWVLNIVPVYNAAVFVDVVFLNTIEFWTGTNPLSMKEGQESIRTVENDGKTYQVITTKNRISIEEITGPDAGKSMELLFDANTSSWYLNAEESSTKIATIEGNVLNLIYPSGKTMSIALSSN